MLTIYYSFGDIMNSISYDPSSDPLRRDASALVLKCGVRADLRGFACLVDAIIISAHFPRAKFCQIYNAVGDRLNVKAKTVMREISYAISQAFDIHSALSAIVGIKIPRADIHSSLVIAYLANELRSKPEA